MKYLYLILLCGLSVNLYSQQHPLGALFDDKEYNATPILSPALRFSSVDLPFYSLKKYCPTPGNQKNLGSCVGWSTGYGALTIAYAIEHNLTNTDEINKHAKSALFIYNQIANCDNGAFVGNALALAAKLGDCDLVDFNPENCSEFPQNEIKFKAGKFKVMESHKLFELESLYETKVSSIINSLNAKKPVPIALTLKKSFYSVGKTGIYSPQDDEEVIGGHALCVIGYDNIAKRFEILNSWGTSWGNNGYFYISYRDFAKYCKYGYQFTVADEQKPNENPAELNLTGVFNFRKLKGYNETTQKMDFDDIKPILSGSYYTFQDGSVKKDDFFRIMASGMQKDNYVYIFSLKPDKTAELIFPLGLSESGSKINDIPLIPADNVSIQIPVDDNKALSTDIQGQDYLCILYSNKKIDRIQDLVTTVNNSQGDIYQRLETTLGDRLIPLKNIDYNSKTMAFSTKTTQGDIAPIVLRVNVQP